MDAGKALRNILAILQDNPIRYRCFGVYWWPVKRMLRERFGPSQLYLLGNYEDADGASRVPALSDQAMLVAALEEYALNVRYSLGRNTVVDPEGEPYTLIDTDAGGV